jgi:pantoate--beta-alanine ligase
MSLSSRYSSFTQDQKIKFAQCASIIKSNLINLKKNFNQKNVDNLQDELKNFGISKIDYCEVRDENDLRLSKTKKRSRLFLAFYINTIRVIDNFILY